jgi:5'-3' exoribonuclease 2
MKLLTSLVFVFALALSNCAYNDPYASHTVRDTQTGALLGGAIGGIIGHQSGEGLAGAAIGAGLGGLIGNSAGANKDRYQAQSGQPYGGGYNNNYGGGGYNTNYGGGGYTPQPNPGYYYGSSYGRY